MRRWLACFDEARSSIRHMVKDEILAEQAPTARTVAPGAWRGSLLDWVRSIGERAHGYGSCWPPGLNVAVTPAG